MSVIKETLVICDGCGDSNNGDDRYLTATKIRAARKAQGWTHRGMHDYCPKCTEKDCPLKEKTDDQG